MSHQHTSYRSLFLVIALATAAIGSIITLERNSLAATLDVSAKVSAVLPTQPAVIEQPINGTLVTKANLVVKGTCQPLPSTTVVALYSGGELLGSTNCLPDGVFSLSVVLRPGLNSLVAKTINLTNDYGPDSAAVIVTYNPTEASSTSPNTIVGPKEQTQTLNQMANERPQVAPLTIRARNPFIIYGPDKPAVWAGSVAGGAAPYRVVVDWNDGTTTTKNIGAEEISLSHTYSSIKTYAIKVSATDTSGQAIISTFLAATAYQSQRLCNQTAIRNQPDWAYPDSAEICLEPPQVTAPTVPLGPLKGAGVVMLAGGYLAALSAYAASWIDARVFAFRAAHLGRLGGRYPRSLMRNSVTKK